MSLCLNGTSLVGKHQNARWKGHPNLPKEHEHWPKGTELTTEAWRTCLLHLFFRSDLCHLIKAKTIHVVWAALQSQELMLLEALQRKDVSAYTRLNTAVNISSAMIEHKYKTGSDLWTRTQMHVLSQGHSSPPIQLHTNYIHTATQTQTRSYCMYTGNTQTHRQERDENSKFSKCLTAHKTGAKTTNGHMSREKQQIVGGIYRENPNTAKCVSADSTWSRQHF